MSRRLKFALILLDVLALIASFVGASIFRQATLSIEISVAFKYALGVFIILSAYYLFGAYSYSKPNFKFKESLYLLGACFTSGVAIVFLFYLDRLPSHGLFGRGIFLGGMFLFWVMSTLVRSILAKFSRKAYRQSKYLVLCEKEYYPQIQNDVTVQNKGEKYCFLVDGVPKSVNVIGDLSDLRKVTEDDWSAIIVGLNTEKMQMLESELMLVRMKGFPIYSIIAYYEQFWNKIPIFNLKSTWFIFSEGFLLLRSTFRFRVKRLSDILFSSALLVATSPFFALGVILIKLTSPGAIFFRQTRSGEFGEPFEILKLRTMRLNAESNGPQWSFKGDNRITPVGRWLRMTRIDELPQLVNVLRGEMSLVGPRPERPEFDEQLKKAIPFYDLRYQVKPGITGWAQVSYRYGASVEDAQEKLQYDLFYIKRYSLIFDLMIILKTIRVVLKGAGL